MFASRVLILLNISRRSSSPVFSSHTLVNCSFTSLRVRHVFTATSLSSPSIWSVCLINYSSALLLSKWAVLQLSGLEYIRLSVWTIYNRGAQLQLMDDMLTVQYTDRKECWQLASRSELTLEDFCPLVCCWLFLKDYVRLFEVSLYEVLMSMYHLNRWWSALSHLEK